jgi:hypothetical protein
MRRTEITVVLMHLKYFLDGTLRFASAMVRVLFRRDVAQFVPFRSAAAIRRVAASSPVDEALSRAFRTPLVSVRAAAADSVPMVQLNERAVRTALAREHLRAVPFPLGGIQSQLGDLHAHDSLRVLREITHAQLVPDLVYTPGMYLLLMTPVEREVDAFAHEWCPATIPLHRVFLVYRTVLMMISEVDFFTGNASPAALEPALQEWASDRYSDMTEAYTCYLRVLAASLAAKRSLETDVAAAAVEQVEPPSYTEFLVIRRNAIETNAALRERAKRAHARATEHARQWDAQMERLFEVYGKLCSHHLATLVAEPAPRARGDAHFMYAVRVLNALEQMLERMCRVPGPLCAFLRTSAERPRPQDMPPKQVEMVVRFSSGIAVEAAAQLDRRAEFTDDGLLFPREVDAALVRAAADANTYDGVMLAYERIVDASLDVLAARAEAAKIAEKEKTDAPKSAEATK